MTPQSCERSDKTLWQRSWQCHSCCRRLRRFKRLAVEVSPIIQLFVMSHITARFSLPLGTLLRHRGHSNCWRSQDDRFCSVTCWPSPSRWDASECGTTSTTYLLWKMWCWLLTNVFSPHFHACFTAAAVFRLVMYLFSQRGKGAAHCRSLIIFAISPLPSTTPFPHTQPSGELKEENQEVKINSFGSRKVKIGNTRSYRKNVICVSMFVKKENWTALGVVGFFFPLSLFPTNSLFAVVRLPARPGSLNDLRETRSQSS